MRIHSGLSVLVVDDGHALRESLARWLRESGLDVAAVATAAQAERAIRRRYPDVALIDLMLSDRSGLDLLRRFRRDDPALPVIMMTADADINGAVGAMKEGATDFLTKPIDTEVLRAKLDALFVDSAVDGTRMFSSEVPSGSASGLVGISRAMRNIREQVAQLASSDATALITGESGTGKEVVARAIHESSNRRERPCIAVNAAAIPEGLVESEIFGHDEGAFTGASKSRPGCFELADGGTLFLDEISEMPLALQPKLLRVLEERRARRLGSAREVAFDVRVIAATNRPPLEAVRDGRLREDLLYRLNVFELALPPLRERLEDLPLLVRHFMRHFNTRHGSTVSGTSSEAMDRLEHWRWPGNVRELRNVIERAVVIARTEWIEVQHLPPHLTEPVKRRAQAIELPVDCTLADTERLVVLGTLERTGHNKAKAARMLGIDVKTIRNKLRTWGISP